MTGGGLDLMAELVAVGARVSVGCRSDMLRDGSQAIGATPFAHNVNRSSSPNSSYFERRPEWASPSSRIFRTLSPRVSNTCPVRRLRILAPKLTGNWSVLSRDRRDLGGGARNL